VQFDGRTLRIVRRALNMSQAQFAARVNVSTNFVSMVERGERPMPARFRAALPVTDDEIAELVAAHERVVARKGE